MKIVLDTNCLVNIIMPGSYNNDIWLAFRAAKYVLCVTNEILFEYHEILAKRYNTLIANTVMKDISLDFFDFGRIICLDYFFFA